MTDYQRYSDGDINAFALNILTLKSDEKEELISKLKSRSFIQNLDECKKKNIRNLNGNIPKL